MAVLIFLFTAKELRDLLLGLRFDSDTIYKLMWLC